MDSSFSLFSRKIIGGIEMSPEQFKNVKKLFITFSTIIFIQCLISVSVLMIREIQYVNKISTINEEVRVLELKINGFKHKINNIRGKFEYIGDFECTAYTAGFESCGKLPSHPEYGITASGEYVEENYTIAMGRQYPFGTIVYIEDIGFRVCKDRGSAITNKHIDIYMEDLDEALRFGRVNKKVYLISLPNE